MSTRAAHKADLPRCEAWGITGMPLVLTSKEQYDRWLEPKLAKRRQLGELMRPPEDGVLGLDPGT